MPAVVGISDEDLLVALANTGLDGVEELEDEESLAAWWTGLVGPVRATASSAAGLRALRDLRTNVRAAAGAHSGVVASASPPGPLEALVLRPQVSGGEVRLVPRTHGDLASEVAAVALVALLRASAGPGWGRFKSCPGADCGWVFVDASRNRSRRWCDMTECGNRAKTTAFRARRRASGGTATNRSGPVRS